MNISAISLNTMPISANLKQQNSTVNFKRSKNAVIICLPKFLEQERLAAVKQIAQNRSRIEILKKELTQEPNNETAASVIKMYEEKTKAIIKDFNTKLVDYCNKMFLNVDKYKWFYLW